MNREQIGTFLACLGTAPAPLQNRAGWVVARCPLAPWKHTHGDRHPSFGVRCETGESLVKCFSCGFGGLQRDLVLAMRYWQQKAPAGPFRFAQAWAMAESAAAEFVLALDAPDFEAVVLGDAAAGPQPFDEGWLAEFPPVQTCAWAIAYLASRGVPPAVAQELDLRADPNEGRVCFPVRDFKQRLMGLHGRAVGDTTPRYRMYKYAGRTNPQVWLGEAWVDPNQPVVVVEGPFDLASVFRVARNVVSPLFAAPSRDKLLRMADALEWVTMLDRGAAGDAGRQRIDRVLSTHSITHLLPTGKDPGEMSVADLRALLHGRAVLRPT